MKSSQLVMMFLLLCVSGAGMGEASASGGHRHAQAHPHPHGHRQSHPHRHVHRHRHVHGPIVHFGFSAGPTLGPYPRSYAPVLVERVPPPVYIERQPDELPATSAPRSYWYYCGASQGYYPYVNECPGGWQRVPPRPAGEF